MKNISGQYQDLLEGKMSQAQFLRNARMMFPSFVTNHNSFDDSVRILKQKGMLNEGNAVKGTPDKEPTYEPVTPDDKIKYKKVEQSPEVDEQNGIYPATTITDIPKEKTYKKVKNESDGLEPIKDNDTKNEMKKVKVVKENMTPEEIETAEVEISQNRSSIQAMADKMGISQEELFKLLLKRLGGLNEIKTDQMPSDTASLLSILKRIEAQTKSKFFAISNADELKDVFDYILDRVNPTLSSSATQLRTALNQAVQSNLDDKKMKKAAPKLESLINKVMNETLSKKSAK
jgi:hypothetical protein